MKPRRLLLALVVGASVIVYLGYRQLNTITGEPQLIGLSVDQEVALGLAAAGELTARMGGPSPDRRAAARVAEVGARLIDRSSAGRSPYVYRFHLLAEGNIRDAFALPGGQVFVTTGLLRRLRSNDELAAALGHEIGHVVGRHGAEHLARAQLTQALIGVGILAGPATSRTPTGAVATAINELIGMRFAHEDEIEADELAVRFLSEAGYDPHAMVRLMELLATFPEARGADSGFFRTHPSPDRRIDRIRAAIPGGVTR